MFNSFVYAVLAIGMGCSALQAIRSHRLITSALWLAAVSVQLATLLFLLGAAEVAVIELSVGAGLVTVLFVFAISVAGELTQDLPTIIPRPLAISLTLFIFVLLGWFLLPAGDPAPPVAEATFSELLWQQRAIDVWGQIVIIFAGALGMLGILAEEPVLQQKPAARSRVATKPALGPDLKPSHSMLEEVGDVIAH